MAAPIPTEAPVTRATRPTQRSILAMSTRYRLLSSVLMTRVLYENHPGAVPDQVRVTC